MKLSAWACLVAVLAGTLVAGAYADAKKKPVTKTETLSPEERARRDRVLARVGGVEITVGEIESSIERQSPFLRARYRDPEKLRQFVDDLVRFELLAREAEKRGHDRRPATIRETSESAIQELIRREIDEKVTAASIPEAEVRAYYAEHEAEFVKPEMVRALHVLVATEDEARTIAESARATDIAGFRQLARDHSIDLETKHRGGELRYFSRDGRPPGSEDAPVDPALVHAAFALAEVGDVSDPVPVGEHFSVVKLVGRRPAEHPALADVEHEIRLRLWREKRQTAMDAMLETLRARFKPMVFEERMKPIALDPAPPAPGFPAAEAASGPSERNAGP